MTIDLRAWCAALLLAVALPAAAQPSGKTIRFIAPYTPGGVVDNTSRVVAERMSRELGQPIVIENRAGANGQIGSELVAKSPPDGLTLLIVVNPKLPVTNLRELVEHARKNGLRYGSSGTGGPSHLAAELLSTMSGVPMTHVPYKGDSAAIIDVMGGNVDMSVSSVSAAAAFIRGGRLRAIAMTSDQRSATLPDVPTAAEAGFPGLVADSWVGMLAPSGTPPEVVRRLSGAALATLADPTTREKLVAAGNTIVGNSPQEFATFLRNESTKWGNVIRSAKIQVDE